MNNLSFDIFLPPNKNGDEIKIEVTENYEGHRWHLSHFRNQEFLESVDVDHWLGIAAHLRELQKEYA